MDASKALQHISKNMKKAKEKKLYSSKSLVRHNSTNCGGPHTKTSGVMQSDPSPAVEQIEREERLAEYGYVRSRFTDRVTCKEMPPSNLRLRLNSMFQQRQCTNLIVQIGEDTIDCHLPVLKFYSQYFIECPIKEGRVVLPETRLNALTFEEMYEWMLAEDPKIKQEHFIPLLSAAYFLGVKDLVAQCWQCLNKKDMITEEDAFTMYLKSRKCGMTVLQVLLERISKFFLTAVSTREFLEFSVDEVVLLLSSSNIGVNSEMEVFMCGVRWVCHKWDEREKHVSKVFKCVRFGLLPNNFLYGLCDEKSCWQVKNVAQNPSVTKWISYYLSKNLSTGGAAEKPNPMEERRWIFDPNADAHFNADTKSLSHITYYRFTLYLTQLSTPRLYWPEIKYVSEINSKKEQMPSLKKKADNPKIVDENLVGGTDRPADYRY